MRLLAPARPRKFLAIGLNYADHIAEAGMEAPEFPVFFNKQVTCVVGPDDDVHMPQCLNLLDYEGELAIVIGARCRHVPVRARRRGHRRLHDRQRRLGARLAGAHADDDASASRSTPTGRSAPGSSRADELGDPHDLPIRTYVNDELRQDGSTAEMIFDCFQQVAHLSEAFTLEPGDVIATGTPAGIGAFRQPFPEGLLKVGDVVRVEIDGIGELRNTDRRGARGLRRAPARRGGGMGALTEPLRAFLDANTVGVLATAASDGRPRQSLVYFARDGGRLLVSTLTDRVKARDVRRTGWASLCVMGHAPPYPSATFSGPAEILTDGIGAPTAAIMQRIPGAAEPPEPMSDEALAEAGRVVLAIAVERVTGASYLAEGERAGSG